MTIELTQEELELVQKLVYNELLKNQYLVKVELLNEVPQELLTLIDKLKEKEGE